MLPAGIGVIASGKIIKHLGVAEQPAPRVVALDQIVAENMVLGERLAGGRLEGVHVVDSLAGETSQAEQVHVSVGSGRRIGIDAPRCRQQGGKMRVRGGRQVEADPRLEHAIAFDHPAVACASNRG